MDMTDDPCSEKNDPALQIDQRRVRVDFAQLLSVGALRWMASSRRAIRSATSAGNSRC